MKFDDLELEFGPLKGPFADFFHRIAAKTGGESLDSNAGEWLVQNTRIKGNPYSYEHHEYQIGIVNDTSATMDVMKCAQVGMSELTIRISLALLAMRRGLSLIYVLPSEKFAREFTKTRIDPVIEDSPVLQRLLVAASDSAVMKRFDKSILYMAGAATMAQAISRPAEALIIDEFDHCNQQVLTAFNSRLLHVLAPDEPFRRNFSTPTVPGFGISLKYEVGSKLRYMVQCRHCNHRQAPNFIKDVVIPGFNGEDFSEFSKDDLQNANYDIDGSYISCQKCKKELDSSLLDPSRREWVAERPNARTTSRAVKPFDVPAYNRTRKIILGLAEYSRTQDYYNFVLGEPYGNDENQVNPNTLAKLFVNTPVYGGEYADGWCIGIDVGSQKCEVMIGRKIEGAIQIGLTITLRRVNGPFIDQISKLVDDFKPIKLVIDAAPDYSLGQALMEKYPGVAHTCVYVNGRAADPDYYKVKEDTQIITMARTRGFDMLVRDTINRSKMTFPVTTEEQTVKDHMGGMKRVDTPNDEGELTPQWTKIKDDHFLHACMYMRIAVDLAESVYTGSEEASIADITGMGGVKPEAPTNVWEQMRKNEKAVTRGDVRAIMGLFGVR